MGLWDSIKNVASKALTPLGKSVGKAVAGIPGAVVGGAMDFAGSYLQNRYVADPNSKQAWKRSEKSAQAAFDRSYEAYKRRYQDTTADLIEAGINPILAASSGFKVGTPPGSPAGQAIPVLASNLSPTSSALNFGKANLATKQAEKVDTEKEELVARAEKQRAQGLKAMAEIRTERYKRNLMSAQESEAFARVSKLENEFRHISKRLLLTAEQTKLTKEQYQLIKGKAEQLKLQMRKLRKTSDAYTNVYGTILGYIEATLRAIGLHFTMSQSNIYN